MGLIEASFRGRIGEFVLDAAFAVPASGTSAIFGPSGGGKTSLLDAIAGITRFADGQLTVDEEVWQAGRQFVPPHRRRIGYVFQGGALFPHLTVAGNLRYGLRRAGPGRPALGFDEAVAMLRLAPLLERRPAGLSGGERQRVALGRALLAQPRLLLLDEPLSGLDQPARGEILLQLERLQARLPVPVLLVTHDLGEVARLADRVIRLEAGRVAGVESTASALVNPDLPFARAPEASSLLAGTVKTHDPGFGLTLVAVEGGRVLVPLADLAPGAAIRLRVFASDVALSRLPVPETTIQNHLAARITNMMPVGSAQVTAVLRLGEGGEGAAVLARVTRKSWEDLALAPGQRVWLLVKAVSLS